MRVSTYTRLLSCWAIPLTEFGRRHSYLLRRSVLIFLLFVGTIIRFSYLLEMQAHPDFLIPLEYQQDMGFNDNTAFRLAQYARRKMYLPPLEKRFERTIFWAQCSDEYLYRPPTYTVFLATLYFFLGDNQFGIRIAQMLLGLCAACLGYAAGKRLYNRWVGFLIYSCMLFYWPLVIYESVLHSPVMAIFTGVLFLSTALAWAQTGTYIRAATMGIAFSAYILSVTAMLLLLPVLIIWILWVDRNHCRYKKTWGRYAVTILVFLLVFSVPVCSVIIYNYTASGRVVLVSGGVGMTLYIGNQPESDGYLLSGDAILDQFLPEKARNLRTDEKAALVPWPEVSAEAYRVTMDHIRRAPIWFLRLSLRRAILFWSPKEISQIITEYTDRLFSNTLSWLPGNFTVVFTLSLLGLGLFTRKWAIILCRWYQGKRATYSEKPFSLDGFTLILLIILVWYAPYCFLWVSAHYRAPLLPHLFAFGALGLCEAFRHLYARRWRAITWGLVGPVLVLPPMLAMPISYEDDIERWVYFRVRHYEERGQYERAADIAERVVARAPEHAFAHMTYGNVLMALTDRHGALRHLEKAVELDTGTIERCATLKNIGMLHRELDHAYEAEKALRKVLECDASHPATLNALGQYAFERGDYDEAIQFLQRAIEVAPENANAYFLFGLSLTGAGSFERAEAAFRTGMGKDPEDIWIILALADLFVNMGREKEACPLYKKALSIDPGNERGLHGVDNACPKQQ